MTETPASPLILVVGSCLLTAAVMLAAGPPAALLLCIVIVGVLLLFHRPMAFVVGCAVVICTNASDVATDVYHLPPVGGLLVPLLAVTLLARVAGGREDLTGVYKVFLPVVIYLFGRSVSLLYVSDTGVTGDQVIKLGKDLLILLVFVGFLTSMIRVRAVAAAAGFSIAAIAVLSDFQYLTGTFQSNYFGFANAVIRQIVVGTSDSWRLTGPLTDANFFGQMLVIGMPLVLIFAVLPGHPIRRILSVLAALAILLAIAFTFSRGALVALGLIGLLAVTALKGSRIYLLGAAGLVGMSLLFMPQSLYERLVPVAQAVGEAVSGGQFIQDPALGQRRSVAAVALAMSASNPWLGIGFGQFPAQYANYALMEGYDIGAPHEAHNLYLETLAEGGILGLTLLIAMTTGSLFLARRARRALAAAGEKEDAAVVRGIALSTLGFLATSIFLHGAYQRFLWFDVALLLAIWAKAQYHPSSGKQSHPMRKIAMTSDRDLLLDTIRLLRRWAWLIVALSVIGLCAGLLQVKGSSREYRAEQTLLYRFGRDYFPITPGEARRDWGENVMVSLDNALFTEMRLLTSHDVFQKTVWSVLPDQLQNSPLSPAERLSQAADGLSRKFAVERVQGATMVTVSASATDPALADRLVDAQVAGYLVERNTLFNHSTLGFYDSQIKASLDNLAKLTEQRAAIVAKYKPDDGAAGPNATAKVVELQPVDTAITSVNANLELLTKERSAAVVSEQYRQDVMPVVKVVDREQAAGNAVGLPPTARVAMMTAVGLVIGVVLVFLISALTRARRSEG